MTNNPKKEDKPEFSQDLKVVLEQYWRIHCDKNNGRRLKCPGCDDMKCDNSWEDIFNCMHKRGLIEEVKR